MIREVDKRVFNKTLQCKKNFNCVKTSNHECCKVEHCVNNQVHFVKCPDAVICNYKMNFGGSSFCSCPVRKEIYNKYRV